MDDVAFPSVRGREVLELDELDCVGTKFKMLATTPQAPGRVHIQHREYETLANNIVLQPRRIPGGSLNQVRFARVCFSVGMSYSFCRATACFFPHHLVSRSLPYAMCGEISSVADFWRRRPAAHKNHRFYAFCHASALDKYF